MTALLQAQALQCVRDRRVLFGDLNFVLDSAQVLQIEGANGAGKTSLMRIIAGLAQAQQGEVYWRGAPLHRVRSEYYSELLYIGHQPALKEELTALENLSFYQTLGGHGHGHGHDLEAALDAVGLFGFEDVPVKTLSAGQRRRVALARLWLSSATLWILDEPFTAIDAAGIKHLEARLQRHVENGGCLLLTSHQPVALAALQRLRLHE